VLTTRGRLLVFVALCAACVLASALYVVHAARSARRATTAPPATPVEAPRPAPPVTATAPAPTPAPAPAPIERAPAPAARPAPRPAAPAPAAPSPEDRPAAPAGATPRLLFRSTALGPSYGMLAVVPLDAPTSPPTVTALRCDRLDAVPAVGVCLGASRGVFTTYHATIFDAELRPQRTIRLGGVPSRVRVSPDGRLAAITVFVNGHSYAATTFSTLTSIVDLATGDSLVDDLEKLTVWRDGKRFREVDFNLWGVTFARDGRRFYATLRSGGRTYLIEGDAAAREARIVRENVECPSLSPDNTRVAFKKREGGGLRPVTWRLSVLSLESGEEWPLAETRSVDDQVEWLDDRTILYSLPAAVEASASTDTWVVSADKGAASAPRLFLANTYSAVVRR
jgi:hypothetical protein